MQFEPGPGYQVSTDTLDKVLVTPRNFVPALTEMGLVPGNHVAGKQDVQQYRGSQSTVPSVGATLSLETLSLRF